MINKSRAARRQRLDKMKKKNKKNKNYLSLAEQGIKKAWDKAVIFKDKITGKMQIVVYYENKPLAFLFHQVFNLERHAFHKLFHKSAYVVN